jgi:uncharacterized membrane-anchored protein
MTKFQMDSTQAVYNGCIPFLIVISEKYNFSHKGTKTQRITNFKQLIIITLCFLWFDQVLIDIFLIHK